MSSEFDRSGEACLPQQGFLAAARMHRSRFLEKAQSAKSGM
jgi:hypothetical protein